MYHVSSPMPQGIGGHSHTPSRLQGARPDRVDIGDRARRPVAAGLGAGSGGTGTDSSGAARIDCLLEAAKAAAFFLDRHPMLARMPLGQVIAKLIDGVTSLAGGSPLDADLQMLAKRVGHFVQEHPRLAGSEFGQIVSGLVRSFPATGRRPSELRRRRLKRPRPRR